VSKRLLAVYAAFAIFILVLTPTGGASAEGETPALRADAVADKSAAVYIIRLADDPVVAYDGGIGKLRPTRPGTGRKINPNSKKVRDYVAYLTGAQNAAASLVGATPFYNYTYAFNGFAAKLTGQQAAALANTPGVISVQEDYLKFPDTDNTPDFLGLTTAGVLHDAGVKGEGVIVGVIDTGIWPEHPSFSDQMDLSDPQGRSGKRNLAYGPPPAAWHGSCQSGELFSQQDCNNKLIGARYFKDGFTNNEIKVSNDYLSARDGDGHGTHTASTAAGNAGVSADIFGADLGTISGIAPRARVAMYKACWADAGCFGTDLTMAIDQAVADGVDVINYSIGGGGTALLTSDSISFLFAESAGVYVATSAGNGGPGAETVGTPAVVPWVTSVGASTQDRTFEGTVELGDGQTFSGASVTPGTEGFFKLVDAGAAGSELCFPGALDPGVVAGNIVLCTRGAIARVDKSLAVSLAGGVGMVLYNPVLQSQVTDNHHVPSVHIDHVDGPLVEQYIMNFGVDATAKITGGAVAGGATSQGSTVAAFSSRGPNGGAFDIIKPDVTAPGVNILAGNSPTPFLGAPGQLFQAISGTSMSSPHVAGSFALLKELHPDWSPAMAKSALMTTARQDVFKEDGSTDADPFDMGAGHIVPTSAADPGLVYDAGFFDYIDFLCGAGSGCFFGSTGIDPSDLNLASISIGELAGFQTITRTLTDVGGGGSGSYEVSVAAPTGIVVVVDPTSLTFGPGESKSYTVTFTTTSAPVDQWTFGSLTWSDGSYSVYSPIAVRPTALAAPGQLGANVAELGLNFDVTFGYGGVYTTSPEGLVAATTAIDTVVDDPANDINIALGTGVGVNFHVLEIPSGTTHARFALFDDFTDGEDDLDLYAFGPGPFFPQVGASGSGTSVEQIDLVDPSPGMYIVIVHGWQTDGPDSTYTLFSWLLDDLDAGNMSVIHTGGDATLGGTATVMVTWQAFPTPLGLDDLTEGTKYLGAVAHGDAGGTFARTLIFIDG
jgi:subtilisin family serine protease